MKTTLFLLITFGLFSCGDMVLSEKIIARSQLDALVNYQVNSMYVTENEAYVNFSKSIFDKTQIQDNCVSPLKEETEGWLYQNQNFSKSSNTFNPVIYGLKREEEHYFRIGEDYSNNLRRFLVEEFTLDYQPKSKRYFDFIGKLKVANENIFFGKGLNMKNNEYAVTYFTDNSIKTSNTILYMGFTNGGSLSNIYSYEFKNRTNNMVVGMILGKDGNPYILTRPSSKTEATFVLLKFDVKKSELLLEKEFELKDVGLSKIEQINDDTFLFYHSQDYLVNPNIYSYSVTTKEVSKMPLDLSKIERDYSYCFPQVNYEGEKFLLYFLKSESKAMIAELTKDLKVNPIFVKKEAYSMDQVIDTVEGGLVLYEVTNSGNRPQSEVYFYRHRSLSDIYVKKIYGNHAGVKQCYNFE